MEVDLRYQQAICSNSESPNEVYSYGGLVHMIESFSSPRGPASSFAQFHVLCCGPRYHISSCFLVD